MTMDRRTLLATGGAFAFGAAALAAVESGVTPAEAASRDNGLEAELLRIFDELDFDVYSNQKWDRIGESHSPNIRVHWPDGHITEGIAQHVADLKQPFVFAPNTRVTAHPLKIAKGNMTAVTGIASGTFTRPMPKGDGTFIQPTGKTFVMNMCTVGIWNPVTKTMDEEYLFNDQKSFMDQLGIG
jgi:hypothetical protein